MGKAIDLTGQKFGRLTVVKRAPNKGTHACWWCRCNCGNSKLIPVIGTHLRTGNTKSCGCLQIEIAKMPNSERKNVAQHIGYGQPEI